MTADVSVWPAWRWFVTGLGGNVVVLVLGMLASRALLGPQSESFVVVALPSTLIGLGWLVVIFKGRIGAGCGFRVQLLLALGLIGFSVLMLTLVAESTIEQSQSLLLESTGLQQQLPTFLAAGGEERTGEIYLRGKVAVVDLDREDFHSLQFRLPEQLLPEHVDEVGTVVKISKTREVVGRYEGGGDAVRFHLHLVVIDLKHNSILATPSFAGSDPPDSTESSNGDSGNVPTDKVLRYLEGLKHKRG